MSSFFERNSSNLKPSELPIDTVIEPDGWGRWIKVEGDRWQEVDVPDAFFPEYIYDAGADDRHKMTARTLEPTDEVFTDFKIVAYPAALVERIAEDLAQEIRHDWHTNDTWVSVVRSTLEDMQRAKDAKPKDLTPELARDLGMVKAIKEIKERSGKANKEAAGPEAPGADES